MAALVRHFGHLYGLRFNSMDSDCGLYKVNLNHKISSDCIDTFSHLRCLGFKIIEDSDSAFFPEAELREVYGIVPHEPTPFEVSIFCMNPDGSEGMCCSTYAVREETLHEEE